MKAVFCWPCPPGYIISCFKELASRRRVDLAVLGFEAPNIAQFDPSLVDGLTCHLMNQQTQKDDFDFIEAWVIGQKPDVVVLPGWGHRPYMRLRKSPRLRGARFITCIDSPGRGPLRRQLVRLVLGRYLHSMDLIVVAGERAFQYARTLGVAESRIRRGLYSCDERLFGEAGALRFKEPWPRRFLYVGRHVPEKATEVLVGAYKLYHDTVRDPWPLTCCGKGPLAHLLEGVAGIEDRGFVQPTELGSVYAEHGVFVLPSRYEPWGVVIAEAAASGLPIICSEACGASVELVRHRFNGLVLPTGDARMLAAGMQWVHDHVDALPEWGDRSRHLAAAFSATVWADRWEQYLSELK